MSDLDQKKKLLERKKANVQKLESLIKAQEKKEDLKKKFKMGELVEKSGLDDLDLPTLLGALLSLKGSDSANQRILWKKTGRNFLNIDPVN